MWNLSVFNYTNLSPFQLQWAMMLFAAPTPRLQPRCCSGWALLTQRSSLQPAHGSSPPLGLCSSTSRCAAPHFLFLVLSLKLWFGSWDVRTFQLASAAPVILTWHESTFDCVLVVILHSHSTVWVCAGHRAGKGGCEEGPCCAQPTPEHPYLPGGREG